MSVRILKAFCGVGADIARGQCDCRDICAFVPCSPHMPSLGTERLGPIFIGPTIIAQAEQQRWSHQPDLQALPEPQGLCVAPGMMFLHLKHG